MIYQNCHRKKLFIFLSVAFNLCIAFCIQGFAENVSQVALVTDSDVHEPCEETGIIMGDIDLNGKTNASDARDILRIAVRLYTPDANAYIYGDIDSDGKITSKDARLALRIAVKLEKQERHLFQIKQKILEPTCNSFGKNIYECENCKKCVTETINPLVHDWKKQKILEPTCTNTGKNRCECKICNLVTDEIIKPLGHKWTNQTLTARSSCTVCKAVNDEKMNKNDFLNEYMLMVKHDEIKKNINMVSEECGSRWYTYDGCTKACNKIKNRLIEYGFSEKEIITDEFYYNNARFKNIYAVIKTKKANPDIMVVSAHYDSYHKGKGAVDNASGVTSALEVARILKSLNADFGMEIRICFFSGEELGYYGTYRYCNYFINSKNDKAQNINSHKYLINIDMSARPNYSKDYYLAISTEPYTKKYGYRKAQKNDTSIAFDNAKNTVGSCTETEYLSPLTAGYNDLLPFREIGIEGITLAWREKASVSNPNDYNLLPPSVIHTKEDIVSNIHMTSLYKTTELIVCAIANILYEYV